MTDPVVREGADSTTGWPAELNDEYDFLGELGRGGMAVVYRARERALGREVAVKVVRPRFHADEEAVARLAREARTVAQLEHPNIVSLHAIKRLNNGLALVMQIVPGQTLKAALAGGSLPADRVEGILRDIARALAYAHRCGVVHRDVKPENIFLDEVTGRALLSDFGVARSISENTELTATGTAIGTPTYMSPEQIDGGALDGRSDLYALGMVGWEMLTGQRPWAGESLYSVIYRQKHDALQPLDAVRPDVPPRLQFLIEGLMAKRPEHRWPSAARFLTLLTSQDKLPGFSQWQAASRKRRKAGTRGGRSVEVRAVSPVSSTVEFRRGETPPGTVPSSLNAVPATMPGESQRPVSPWGQPAIEAPFDHPAAPRRAWLVGAITLGLVAAGALGIWASGRTAPEPAAFPDSARFADAPGLEVPLVQPSDSGAVPVDTLAAAGLATTPRDSGTGAPPAPAVAPPADSTKQATATLTPPPVPERAPLVVAAPADSAARRTDSVRSAVTAPAPPPLNFPAERGTIAAGTSHSCMLDGEGRAQCWGRNERGQLGDGTFTSRRTPAPVAGAFGFVFVSSGGAHSCGVSRDGEAYCWGANESGQLGDGTTSPRNAPVRVSGSASYRVIAVGTYHSCAVTSAGEARCWGRNDAGQLGDGSTTDRPSPVTVASREKFVHIASGNAHTCAVVAGGEIQCWGQNSYGQLGSGNTLGATSPVRVDASVGFATVSAGAAHTCARGRDGKAWCWGRNVYGQLGDGTSEDRLRPTAVRGVGAFSAVNASGAHTCGVIGGEAYCWGYNVDGQLGTGDQENATSPARVAGTVR